jgi:transposase-like protein
MKYRTRTIYTPEQKAQMWDRWEKGDSLHSIARLFDRGHSSVFGQLSPTGGIRPPARKRPKRVLSTSEREEISRGIVNGLSLRTIATQLTRAPSTISREVSRNGGYDHYRATEADKKAWDRALRPKRCKLAENRHLSYVIARKLKSKWSPEQIAGWLKREYPKEELKRVSHETIYRSLYIQARGVLKKELLQHLRTKRVIRRSKHSSLKKNGLGKLPIPFPSASDRLQQKTEQCRDIGKAISSVDRAIVISQRWLSVIHAT